MTIASWSVNNELDRLGRSVKDVLTIADELYEHGIGLRILTGTLAGTYTPTGEGKFFFTVMAAFAELERDMIHQRTMAGLAAARAQGRVGGRPSVMDADKLAAATARLARGESPTGRRSTGTPTSSQHAGRAECQPWKPLALFLHWLDHLPQGVGTITEVGPLRRSAQAQRCPRQ